MNVIRQSWSLQRLRRRVSLSKTAFFPAPTLLKHGKQAQNLWNIIWPPFVPISYRTYLAALWLSDKMPTVFY